MRVGMGAVHRGIGDGDFNWDDILGGMPSGGGSGVPDWITIDNGPSGPGDFSTPYDYAMYMGLDVPPEARTSFGTSSFPKTPPQGSGISTSDWAKLVQVSSQALISGVKSTQSPFLIPGTNLVYDPASGKIQSGVGVTASQLGTSFLPMLGIASIALLAVFLAKGK